MVNSGMRHAAWGWCCFSALAALTFDLVLCVTMALRRIKSEDLTTLSWIDIPRSEMERVAFTDTNTEMEWWRIVAELSCSSCGAFQAADSDPTNDKEVAITLTLRLFNDAGWRVDGRYRVVCENCAQSRGCDR